MAKIKGPVLQGASLVLIEDTHECVLTFTCKDAWDAEELYDYISHGLRTGSINIGLSNVNIVRDSEGVVQ